MKATFTILLISNSLAALTLADSAKPEPPSASPLLSLPDIGVEKYGKKSREVLEQYSPAISDARHSTAQVFEKGGKKQLALATVVSEKGYLISKASEVQKVKEIEILLTASPVFPNGLRLGAKLVDTYRPYDLALLQVEPTGLKPAVFSSKDTPSPGSFLVASGTGSLPLALGVASVNTRNFDDANKGFLGVLLRSTAEGLSVERVTKNSAAHDAGLKEKDIVLKVNGTGIASVEEFIQTIGRLKPTETVKIHIKRESELKDISAVLRRRGEFPEALRRFEDPRNLMSGALSEQRTGFPAAMQHDLYLRPSECGGPITNLDGEVIGINIARSGRIESLAIPSATVTALIKNVSSGKFYHPEVEELQKSKANIEAEVNRLDEMEVRLKKELDEITKKLEAISAKK